jgi:hypothetical protein
MFDNLPGVLAARVAPQPCPSLRAGNKDFNFGTVSQANIA